MSEAFEVDGPSPPLRGHVELTGGKNAALPMMLAACLGQAPVRLENLPLGLGDVAVARDLLAAMGARWDGEWLDPGDLTGEAPALAGRLRSSLVLLGVGLATRGRAIVPLPGGCRIGARPFDLHLAGLRALGARIEAGETLRASAPDGLRGAEITFPLPTTTGTQNVVLAACAAQGRTVLRNANTRPENEAMFRLLRRMGARIHWEPRLVVIDGGAPLGGATAVIPSGFDEAMTWLIAGAITGGCVSVGPLDEEPVTSEVAALRAAGLAVECSGGRITCARRPTRPLNLFTSPPPGVGSDMQPLFGALACAAPGESRLTDLRFTERFQYLEALRALGAVAEARGNTAVIRADGGLTAADVTATDLRGGMAALLAALLATGRSRIAGAAEIDRGYAAPEATLTSLGAPVRRIVL